MRCDIWVDNCRHSLVKAVLSLAIGGFEELRRGGL